MTKRFEIWVLSRKRDPVVAGGFDWVLGFDHWTFISIP